MEKPIPQQIYRHFKGNLYQVLTIAVHSETKEELVIYQALYGDYKVYARPLSMFLSPVDRVKYPEAKQAMRFELVNPSSPSCSKNENENVNVGVLKPQKSAFESATDKTDYMNKTIEDEAKELNLDPNVVAFLDSDSAKDRIQILERIRPIVTDDMIDIMAMAIDVEVEPGDVYDRLSDLRNCLDTIARFETERLR